MKEQEEVWKPVSDYEELYHVSNFGRVLSKKNNLFLKPRKKISKITSNKRRLPYLAVVLYKDGNPKSFLIHRLVAGAFINNPRSLPQVNHKDGNVANNTLINLEWVSASENVKHGIQSFGRQERVGEQNNKTKLTQKQVLEIRTLYASIRSQRKLAAMHGVTQPTIGRILKNKTWKHLI